MSFGKNLRGAVVCLACWGLIAPQSLTMAQETPAARQARTSDVEMSKGGVLTGRVLDSQGKPVAKATVTLKFAGQVIARTSSNKNGAYAISGLRGGTHRLIAGSHKAPVRLWAEGKAPASAKKQALSVTGDVVRGQYCPPGGGCAPGMGAPMGYAPPMMDQGYLPMDQGYAPPLDQGYAPPVDGGYCPPGAVGGDFGYGGGAAGLAGGGGGGFGMLDIVTLATVGTSVAALVYVIDNNNEIEDLQDALRSP